LARAGKGGKCWIAPSPPSPPLAPLRRLPTAARLLPRSSAAPPPHPTPPALPAVAASISPAPSYLAVAAHRSLTRTSTPPCALTLVVGPAACARNGLKRLGGGRRSWVRVDGATGASEARQAHADLPPRVRPPPLRSALRLPLRILCNLERIRLGSTLSAASGESDKNCVYYTDNFFREDEEKGSSGTVERACFKELFDIDLKNSRVAG
ncbi:hypothetical protein EJB05_55324, partial [Eragrostis curvula]